MEAIPLQTGLDTEAYEVWSPIEIEAEGGKIIPHRTQAGDQATVARRHRNAPGR